MPSAFKTDAQGDYAEIRVGEVLDFGNDYADEIGNDTISTSNWSVSPALTPTNPQISGTIATAFFSGVTAGQSYDVDNTVVTAPGGRTFIKRFRLIGKA